MSQTNQSKLEKIYAHFSAGKYDEMMSECAENTTFQIAGKSAVSGKFDRTRFVTEVLQKMQKDSNGTLKTEIHDILTSDRHGLVLTTESLTRDGKKAEYRSVHVWRIENGTPVAWYLYPRDLYQFDALWVG